MDSVKEIKNYEYEYEMEVRDSELDIQGVVNNSIYMNYLEHVRHKHLLTKNIDFSSLHNDGKDLIVVRADLNYKYPLRSGDRFIVRQNIRREGFLKVVFDQDIFRLPDNRLILKASITGTCVSNGKPVVADEVFEALDLPVK